MDKRIAILLVIIAILLAGIGYMVFQQHNVNDANATVTNITNNTNNNTTVVNATPVESSQNTVGGEYGHCAICGKALTYSEAHNEYTQGKVCRSCASNPYYQSGDGADYANKKLAEAYPDEYEGMFDDSYEDYDYDTYDDSYYSDDYEDIETTTDDSYSDY